MVPPEFGAGTAPHSNPVTAGDRRGIASPRLTGAFPPLPPEPCTVRLLSWAGKWGYSSRSQPSQRGYSITFSRPRQGGQSPGFSLLGPAAFGSFASFPPQDRPLWTPAQGEESPRPPEAAGGVCMGGGASSPWGPERSCFFFRIQRKSRRCLAAALAATVAAAVPYRLVLPPPAGPPSRGWIPPGSGPG